MTTQAAGSAADSSSSSSSGVQPAAVSTVVVNGSPNGGDGLGSFKNNQQLSPPDMAIAVGPTHLLNAINAIVGLYTLSASGLPSSSPLKVVKLATFFTPVLPSYTPFLTDPVAFYDKASNRFVLVTLAFDRTSVVTNGARLLVAASATSDPTGSWWMYSLPSPTTGCTPSQYPLPDYPQISYDTFAVAISVLRFCGTATVAPYVLLLDKAALYAGGSLQRVPAYDVRTLSSQNIVHALPGLPMAAADVSASATGGIYLVAQSTSSTTQLVILALTNTSNIAAYAAATSGGIAPQLCTPSVPVLSKGIEPYPFDATTFVPLRQPPYANGTAAQQLDTGSTSKVYGSTISNGRLFVATKAYGGVTCITTVATNCQPGVFWGVFKVTSSGAASGDFAPARYSSGILYNTAYGLAYPNIAAVSNGSAWIGYSFSSTGNMPNGLPAYPGLGYTTLTKGAGDTWTAGSIVLTKPGASQLFATIGGRNYSTSAGSGTYYRFGDYSAVDVYNAPAGARVYLAVEYTQIANVDLGGGGWINLVQTTSPAATQQVTDLPPLGVVDSAEADDGGSHSSSVEQGSDTWTGDLPSFAIDELAADSAP